MCTTLPRTVARVSVLLLAACSGSDGVTEPAPPVVVTVTPSWDTLTTGTASTFRGAVTGAQDTTVVWSLPDGPSSGTISAAGLYTAGSAAGTYRIVANSSDNRASADTSRVMIVAVPVAAITVVDTVFSSSTGIVAFVAPTVSSKYTWTVSGGTITSGASTHQVTLTAGPAGIMALRCTAVNLADSVVVGVDTVTVLPAPVPPSIISWGADPPYVQSDQSFTLTAVFAGGTGEVDHGIGPVSSGVPIPRPPLATTTTYTLRVTSQDGLAVTNLATVVVFPPFTFFSASRIAPIGGSGLLQFHWPAANEHMSGSIDHGVGAPPAPEVATTPLSQTTTFTATVMYGGFPVIDTATVVAVPPAPGEFVPTGSLNRPRMNPILLTLLDGRVLVLGGADLPAAWIDAIEAYDPATGRFTVIGSFRSPREHMRAVQLLDGRVLIMGGGAYRSSTEFFDPATGAWSDGPDMLQGRRGFLAFRLADGRVLALEGSQEDPWSAELYDPATNSWSLTGSLTNAQSEAVALPDGRIFTISDGGGGLDPGEIYDPTTGLFTPTGSMNFAHSDGSFTALPDGRVLAAGGGGDNGFTAPAEVWNPATGIFSLVGDLALPRRVHTATVGPGGYVVLVGGGRNYAVTLPFDEVFDAATGAFTPTRGSLQSSREYHSAVRLLDGSVLVVGGVTIHGEMVVEAEIFR